jgi:hypothetical protein
MPKRRHGPPQRLPDDPRWLKGHLPWIVEHVAASSDAHGWAIELARRLQHAEGAERETLIEALAAHDAWAWRAGTAGTGDERDKRIRRRENAIRRALDKALNERPVRNEQTGRWYRARPFDLSRDRWCAWLRRCVQTLLRHKE